MGRLVKAFLLLTFLPLAVGCGDTRTLDNEEVGTSTAKLITSNGLTYPIASIGSWADGNFGACGTYYRTGRCHVGTDVMTGAGTPVYAMANGTVIAPVSGAQNPGDNCTSGWGYDYGLSNTCNMGLVPLQLSPCYKARETSPALSFS